MADEPIENDALNGDDTTPPEGGEQPTPPAPPAALTADDIRAIMAEEFDRRLPQQPAPTGDEPGGNWMAPDVAARIGSRLEQEMIEEVRKDFPDLPDEGIRMVLQAIDQVGGVNDLAEFRKADGHLMTAYSVHRRLKAAGKLGEARIPRVESAVGDIPGGYGQDDAQAVRQLETVGGIKFTKEDLAEARRLESAL